MSLINDALKRAKQTQQRRAAIQETVATDRSAPDLQPVDHSPAPALSRGPSKAIVITPIVLAVVGLVSVLSWHRGKEQRIEPVAARELNSTRSVRHPVVGPKTTGQSEKIKEAVSVLEVLPPSPTLQRDLTADPETQPDPVVAATSTEVKADERRLTATLTPAAHPAPEVAAPAPSPPVESKKAEIAKNTPGTLPLPQPVAAPAAVSAAPPAVIDSAATPSPQVAAAPGATSPTDTSTPAPPEFKLQGIFFRIKNPTALVNGKILSVGDSLDGYRVERIERHSIRLSVPGRASTVNLF